MQQTILLVEDEQPIRELVSYNLEQAGYKVQATDDGSEAIKHFEEHKPDLVILDVMLPGKSGLDICQDIRRTDNTPIIMLTAKDAELDRVLGLELGADDYLTKPFSPLELLARIKAVLRRTNQDSDKPLRKNQYRNGNIIIDTETREVFVRDRKITLTRKEFDLLHTLIINAGKVLSRDYLLREVWGYYYAGQTRTVDVHIRHLRRKLGPEEQYRIVTVHGVGYKIAED